MMDDPIPSHGKSCANQLGIARGVWDHDTDDLLNEGRSLVAGCPIARPNLFFFARGFYCLFPDFIGA